MWEAISWDVSIQCGTVFLQSSASDQKKKLFRKVPRRSSRSFSKVSIRGLSPSNKPVSPLVCFKTFLF